MSDHNITSCNSLHKGRDKNTKNSNPKAILILNKLAIIENRRKYPNLPEYARQIKPYRDNTANGLTRCIIDFINYTGGYAERINRTRRRINNAITFTDVLGNQRKIGSEIWISGTGTNGTADISATICGLSVKIEVKIGKDRQSTAQKEYQAKTQLAGGVYTFAKSFQEFFNWYVLKFGSDGG